MLSTKSLLIPPEVEFPYPNNRFLFSNNLLFLHRQLSFPHKLPPNSRPFSLLQNPQFLRPHHPLHASPSQVPDNSSTDHQLDNLEQAQEAISQFLQEFGVPQEESVSIALNSPKYTQMLIDGVEDLDELSLWNSWGSDEEMKVGDLGFKEKIIYMAKEKGDNGKVAFLESIGLSLSSAMYVARYISSETLPGLIHKVKYMKEMFFSGSDDKGLIGRNARRMMMHLSIPVDEDLQQTLSFFEKIEARRGGLDLMGSADASFRYLVESFPRILLLSLKSRLKPMVEYLENIGVPKECLRKILLLFPPIMFCKSDDLQRKILVFEKGPAVDVGKMLVKYPWILSTSIQDNYGQILSFFDIEKVPQVKVEHAIRSWPHLLGCSVSKLKLMVDQFGELGIRNKNLGQVVAKSPQLLQCKPQEFLLVVSFLEGLGFDRETVGQILVRCPELFATSIERTLKKKLGFLTGIGVSKNHLPRVIKKYPELLVSDIDRTLLPRMEYLMEKGLSKRDIAFMVRRFSPLLGYSIDEVLEPKLEFLVNTMEKPVKDVVDYPRYFSYSLERKIKPRYWVLKGRNVECSLKEMLSKNDEEFAAEFLVPSPSTHQ